MFTDIVKHLFHRHPHAPDDEAKDPGFTEYLALLRSRRSEKTWANLGPEGELYRRRCRDDELTRLDSPNYGFPIKDLVLVDASPVGIIHETLAKSQIRTQEGHNERKEIRPVTNLKEYFVLARR